MGGGGGDSFLSKALNNINAGIQFVSGYDPRTGGWSTHGSQFQILDEGLGGVTGRNSARASLNLARDQFNQANKQAQDLVDQNNWNKKQADLTASSSAGAAAATSRASGGVNPNTSTPLGIGPGAGGVAPQKDFLGL